MPTGRSLVVTLLLLGLARSVWAGDPRSLPRVAAGWSIELVKQAPEIRYPTAIVVAQNGTIFLGQDPMDMPGPVNTPIDSVLAIRPDGSTRVFADKLHSVMGLEWADNTLYVVHAPFLSSFRDTNGDGVADARVDLVTGLGPKIPGFNGLNDHVASGIRLGMDGFLYIAVGDKGIPRGVGRDGKAITLSTGGVIRVRPDGKDLEVVSTGERNPLSVALSARDDVFSFGNDDDSHLWPNSLTHHIVGGHYGYPYEFLTAPHRALPIVVGQTGGAGAQGICLNDDGLPDQFRGNLFFCDWGLQTVARYEVAPQGASFRLVRREAIIEKGDLGDFRPFSIAPTCDGSGFYVVDWAYNGWLGVGPPTGRLFRLTYTGPGRKSRRPRPRGTTMASLIDGLDYPTLAVRLEYQRQIVRSQFGNEPLGPGQRDPGDAVRPLGARLGDRDAPATGRIHALWALDAIPSTTAQGMIRDAMGDLSPIVRAEAIRSAGIRRDRAAESALVKALGDPDAPARREAAIALGRLPKLAPGSRTALYAALKEPDRTVAWTIRWAIRSQNAWDQAALVAALADPRRRDAALTLADGSYAPEVVRALNETLAGVTKATTDPAWRARLVAALGGLYAEIPPWSGHWFGSNPVAGPRPMATEPWDSPSMDAVLAGVAAALRDGDAGVRRQAIIAMINIGNKAVPPLRALLEPAGEADPANLLAVVKFLGEQRDYKAVAGLARVLADPKATENVRLAALDALGQFNGPVPINARLMILYDVSSPGSLIARALPALGRAKLLPSNDVIGFLDHANPTVQAAALGAFPTDKPLPPGVVESIMLHADDPAPEVQIALANAAGTHRIAAAVPKLVEWASREGPIQAAAIRALGAMPDRRALAAYVSALNSSDPNLRHVGLAALTAIRAEVRSELTALAGRGAFVGPGALLAERLLLTFHPLVEWRVIGPFPRATGPIFADARTIDFARTEPGAGETSIAWRTRSAHPQTGVVLFDDLNPKIVSLTDGSDASREPAIAFAVAEVTSDRDRPALLIVHATGSVAVAVDDRPAVNFAAAVVGETVRVDLKTGRNRILLRTRQGVGPWSIRVDLSDPPAGSAEAGIIATRSSSIVRAGLMAFAIRHAGDPKNGEAIFQGGTGSSGGSSIGCARCHGVGSRLAEMPGLGPDLTELALKYDKTEIIRSILEPSSRLAVGFIPLVIARTDGTTIAGRLVSESGDAVELSLADGRTIKVLPSEISQRRPGDASMMPEGLVDGLQPIEFADLVAYLMSLRQPARSTGRSN